MPLKVSNLTGFNASTGVAGGTAAITLSTVTAFTAVGTGTAGIAVTFPTAAGVATDDIVCVGEGSRGAADTVWNVPSGYTLLSDGTNTATVNQANAIKYGIYYKQLTGSGDLTGFTTVNANGNWGRVVVHIYRPSSTPSTLTGADVDSEGLATDPASDTITAGSGAAPLIVMALGGNQSTWDAGATAFGLDNSAGTSNIIRFGSKHYNASPANHTVDNGSAGGSQALLSGYLEIA